METIKTLISLLRVLTIAKLWNLILLILASHWPSKRKAQHKPMPYAISVEPCTACNLSCVECPTGNNTLLRPKGNLQMSNYRLWLSELSPYLFTIIFYLQGEPFMHPQLAEMIKMAVQKRIFTQTSTNGHFLTRRKVDAIIGAGLHKIIISVDGPTQASYQEYRRGGNLEKVLQGIRLLQQRKRELASHLPIVEMQFLVLATNEKYISPMRTLAKELGVKLSLKTAQIYDYQQGSPLIPNNPLYSRYRQLPDGSFAIKSKLANHCWRMLAMPVITWDGELLPCCFDKDASHSYGNISQQSFADCWQSDKAWAFSQQLRKGRSHIDICRNCTEGLRL